MSPKGTRPERMRQAKIYHFDLMIRPARIAPLDLCLMGISGSLRGDGADVRHGGTGRQEDDMKAFYKRTPTGFSPDDDAAHKYWSRFKVGDDVLLNLTRPRSLPQLRLYWSLVKIAFDNDDGRHFASTDEASNSIKLACGVSHITHVKFKGEWYERKTPASIAFENMEQDEFNAFFEIALTYVCNELMPGLDPHTLEIEVRAAA
jgi:hypothetical protein